MDIIAQTMRDQSRFLQSSVVHQLVEVLRFGRLTVLDLRAPQRSIGWNSTVTT